MESETFKTRLEEILVAIGDRELGGTVEVNFKSDLTGGGYLGIVNTASVKGRNGHLDLIVKSANTNEAVREKIPLGECAEVEMKFYDVVIPKLAKFTAGKGVHDAFTGVAKSYWVEKFHGFEVIIMENLKVQGYDLIDKMKPMDEEHTAMILRVYAKYHALSLAFKNEHPEEFNAQFCSLDDNVTNWMIKGKMLQTCINNLRSMEKVVDAKIAKKLSEFTDGVSDYILQHDFKSDEYGVFTHGDCWSNNMMFKNKEGTDILESAKLIDFQLARVSSFACDLTHFLATCCDQTIWHSIDHYLKIYHTAMSDQLRKLKSSKIVTFEEVRREFRKYRKFGLIMASFFIKVMYAKSHEVASLEDTINGRFLEPFSKIENDHLYEERMNFLIEYYYKNDWL